ncbi:helix-turn-helix domain-containing protein [Streptomyces sp. NPDC047990]|uniref:helix-turn-helix domain-containing protein n=1 Tax=Streptomyces sp. NPDC047990 TaxID=3365496 RepID=UPI0037106B54
MTPSAPSPSGARLAIALKQLKQRTGLSLAQLAHATTFSKSSWERYLNGKGLPSRSAVKELCRLAGEPADHLLALLDIARTDRTVRSERVDPGDQAGRPERTDPTDPTDRTDRKGPTGRKDRTDRTDPTEDSRPSQESPARQLTATRTDPPAAAPATDASATDASATDPSPTDSSVTGPSVTAPPATGRSETAASETVSSGTAASESPPRAPDHVRFGPATHRRATVLAALASALGAVVLGTLVLMHLPAAPRRQASPSPTSPPVTGALCRHTACENKDPISTRCAASPLTLAEHETTTGAWIQIRYSEECGTSWVRMWGAAVDDRVEISVAGRDDSLRAARVTSRNEADTYVHTTMSVISLGTSVRSCFLPAAGGRKECFEARTQREKSAP